MKQIEVIWDERGVVIIKLNRSEKMNAITKMMARELQQVLLEMKNKPGVKCLVITGAGKKAFCAGGDLTELHGNLNEEEAYQVLHPMKECLYELATFPLPTFAFLNGHARGGGCEIATACDFRYGIEDGEYGFIQGRLGITPGWGGGELLYKRIQADRAAQWLMESNMYSAEEAYRIGWLHKIVTRESFDTSHLLLSPFLQKSQRQLKIFKSQHLHSLSMSNVSSQMDEEVKNCASLWESKEHVRAVENFMRTRKKS
ncbi:enoyl-CoA hydratase/isomerase family protein [Halobacillus sp. B23F22_1]|uniref:enoyl-CoA hydratase/isomerase family protein n=1 Tax=Halobacillus sp. B23F22_1 TaxID=3459514 RepID=UPI00373F330E